MIEYLGRDRLSDGVAVDGERVAFVAGSSHSRGRHRRGYGQSQSRCRSLRAFWTAATSQAER